MAKVKWSGVKEPVPVPPGWYTVVVAKAQDKITRNNDDMIAITFEIIDEGEFKGEKVFTNLVFAGDALPGVKRALEAMGVALEDDMDVVAEDLDGRTVKIQTRMGEYQGQKRPEVAFRGYRSTDVEAPAINPDEAPEAIDDITF